MKIANAMTGLAAMLWSLLIARTVAHQRNPTTSGHTLDWDIWSYIPVGVVIGLLLCGFLFNKVVRSAGTLLFFAAAALLFLLPYLALTGGGV